MDPKLVRTYAVITGVLTAFSVFLYWLVDRAEAIAHDARALLPPIFVLVGLTAVVWATMLIVRNTSVALGRATVEYYRTYDGNASPPDWIERPARTFMNLLEVPVLFYVACVLMLVTRYCDGAQIRLAWLFVALRVTHAAIYIGINHVPSRFASYTAGCVTLGVLWVRLGLGVL
jgi:hypothetical protein